jgi:hypothetical protein
LRVICLEGMYSKVVSLEIYGVNSSQWSQQKLQSILRMFSLFAVLVAVVEMHGDRALLHIVCVTLISVFNSCSF